MVKLMSGDKAIIRQIVDRQHVSASDEEVLQAVISKITDKLSDEAIAAIRKEVVKCHRENRKLYNYVMR